MKNLLIISFDLIRTGEPNTSLSIASLLSYLKQNEKYGYEFTVSHMSFNLVTTPRIKIDKITEAITNKYDLDKTHFIAIASYVWSEYLINNLISSLRSLGFRHKIILGGYQISYTNNTQLKKLYPDCQIFIKGYGEASLLQAILDKSIDDSIVLNTEPDFTLIPSPYLSNNIKIEAYQKRLRFETKRGCPYQCSFCAHRDLQRNKVYRYTQEKTMKELYLFKSKNVNKINVIDPVFNMGKEYLTILEQMIQINLESRISIQTRIENINGRNGSIFLELCSSLNMNLEFGLQTIHKNELKAINRKNNLKTTKSILHKLNQSNISYEVSLIYGLPNQTVDSFKVSIKFLRDNGCKTIKAFPLMLLRGTELYTEREKWNFQEKIIDNHNIPIVVSSNSFSIDDWEVMNELANTLSLDERF